MWGTLCFRELHQTPFGMRILVFFIIVLYTLAIAVLAFNALSAPDDDQNHQPTTPMVPI
jgi:hypothetical protein